MFEYVTACLSIFKVCVCFRISLSTFRVYLSMSGVCLCLSIFEHV